MRNSPLFTNGAYVKPEFVTKVHKPAEQVYEELLATHTEVFTRAIPDWRNEEKEAFVRVMNTCHSVCFYTPGVHNAVVAQVMNNFTAFMLSHPDQTHLMAWMQ